MKKMEKTKKVNGAVVKVGYDFTYEIAQASVYWLEVMDGEISVNDLVEIAEDEIYEDARLELHLQKIETIQKGEWIEISVDQYGVEIDLYERSEDDE